MNILEIKNPEKNNDKDLLNKDIDFFKLIDDLPRDKLIRIIKDLYSVSVKQKDTIEDLEIELKNKDEIIKYILKEIAEKKYISDKEKNRIENILNTEEVSDVYKDKFIKRILSILENKGIDVYDLDFLKVFLKKYPDQKIWVKKISDKLFSEGKIGEGIGYGELYYKIKDKEKEFPIYKKIFKSIF